MAGLFISGVQSSSTDFGKGSQRDLLDAITMVDAKETPFMAMVPKGTAPINALYEWPADKQETPGHNAVADGTGADIAVADFDNAQTSYDILSNRVQWFRRQAMVGKLAQNVQNQAGIKDHYAHAVTKKLTQLKRDAEVRFCSDSIWAGNTTSSTAVDTTVRLYDGRAHSNSTASVAEGGSGTAAGTTIGNRTRCLGEFINPKNNEDAIPSAYKCPDGNVYEMVKGGSTHEGSADSDDTGLEDDSAASPLASALTESQVENVLQSIYEQVGKTQNLTLLAGPNLKKRFKDFTQTQFGANGTTNVASASSIRSYNADLKDKRIISTVDVYEGDFGTLELVPTLWNAFAFGASQLGTTVPATGGFTQAASATLSGSDCFDPQLDGKAKGYGYVIDWNLLELRFNQMPQVQELPDLGGGRRFAVDMITGLVCKNPLGLGAFKCA